MLLVPQIYLKNGKVVLPEGTKSALFKEDLLETAKQIKNAGASAIHCIDLGLPSIGVRPHLPLIQKIRDEARLATYIGGGFKTLQGIESYIDSGASLIVMGSIAYQQPSFLEEACKKFPGKIAVHIDVKSHHVTIPGYAVVSNKTPFDYAEQFLNCGVRYIFYSDVGANGLMGDENFNSLMDFCRKVTVRIICTSEISSFSDIEKIARLGVPRLEGLILGKSLYEGLIDLKSSIMIIEDLSLPSSDEPTMAEL